MKPRILTALPVYNEAAHVREVLQQVAEHTDDVMVVNDGSTDDTGRILEEFPDIRVVNHPANQGYGAALKSSFDYAARCGYDVLVTIDCDGQHQPQLIRQIAGELEADAGLIDMVSGSRYLTQFAENNTPPEERRRINVQITACLNEQLGLSITDAFCGFKAYRVSSLANLDITNQGYAMPLQLWVQAADLGWQIAEFPVPLVYLDANRSFGGSLDDAEQRLAHYREILNEELARRGMRQRFTADCGKSA